MARDISPDTNHHKHTSDDLTLLAKEFENFVYIISHDLQAPLRSITNFSKLLQDRYAGSFDEKGNKHFHYVVHAAETLQKMIDGLLAYSRINTHKEPLECISLAKVFVLAKAACQEQLSASGANLTVDSSLPSVFCDVKQMTAVFQHLLLNAMIFQPPGQRPDIHVTRSTHEKGEHCIAVRDNGIGIAPNHTTEIFEVFRRLNRPDAYPGIGIGLALAKKIIERHQGNIWAESALGKGSTFFFTLPAAKP